MAGVSGDARLDARLVTVSAAADGGAVTILRTSPDPLRQGEFELAHVTPRGEAVDDVSLADPEARPLPCRAADGSEVAYLEQVPGPTADGSTHVVVRRSGRPTLDVTVVGTFDRCAAGQAGVVLAGAATGADGDLGHTVVDVRWLDASGSVVATAQRAVESSAASVALDPARSRVAVAGGPGPAAVMSATGVVERPAAARGRVRRPRRPMVGRGGRSGAPRGRAVTAALELRGLGVVRRRRAIGPFDVRVDAGEIVALVGPNGSGKTSCLRLALGLDPATSGHSSVDGAPVGVWSPPRGVGLVLEADGAYPWCSGRQNLALFGGVLGATDERVERLLAEVGLGDAADRPVRTYSRGMRQRLALARARLSAVVLLVLDEPTVALDDDATSWLVELLRAEADRGVGVLVASHDAPFLQSLDARVVHVDQGRTR